MAISLYIHFPFCTNKCHYCDFYKEVHHKNLEEKFYLAIDKEIELASDTLSDRSVSTIFIGGGTPSLTDLDLFEKMLAKLHEHFEIFPDVEFSMECNPESVSLEVLDRLQKLGVTRPTYGMQSFDTKVLETLGRRHDPHQSQQAVYFSNALGFKTFGTDLIFGVPKQTGKILSSDIDQLIDLSPPHISFYQLTIEEGTRMYDKVSKGLLTPLEQELVMAMYKSGVERFQQAGYVRYEVCSFAKPGHECRHNIGYWEGRDYLGLGPSAHSFING
ncbi:MAG: coproporphyrinogen III oxidase family protein, partial [Calditrichaeota bacterium]